MTDAMAEEEGRGCHGLMPLMDYDGRLSALRGKEKELPSMRAATYL